MASSSTYAFFHCHYAFQKFPFFCVTLCVLYALQNATDYDLYQGLQLQFYVLLMMGAMDTRNM